MTEGRKASLGALLAFVVAFAGSLLLHRQSALHDTDSYYHLAIARSFAHEGIVYELPQLRFSLMRDGFGDKEWFFHLVLAPLAGTLDPLVAGRLGLALLGALAAAAMAALAVRALGWWGVAVPFWLFYASTEVAWRMVRLRPELLSLTLLLAAVAAIGLSRERLLGLVAFLYTWSYTAFQALGGLVFLCFVYFSWSRRRWQWPLVLYPLLGIGLALVTHPHFPKNLEIWVVQNFEYFLRKGQLDVGTEIRPNFTDVLLMVNLGWFAGLGVLVMSSRRVADVAVGTDRRLAEALGITALAFGGLYLLMSRFSLYFFPFATLWLIYELRRRGLRPGVWTYLSPRGDQGGETRSVRGRLPLALCAGLCLLLSFPEARRQLHTYEERTRLGPNHERIRDREVLSARIPDGGRVAAGWGPTATLMLWAPQARYLNVLDPVFMATPYPDAHAKLMDVLEGREPDVALTTVEILKSEYLVYRSLGRPRLEERLIEDPRVEVLHRGTQTLVRFRPAPGAFVLSWHVVPEGAEAFDAGLRVADWPPYPRSGNPRTRMLEAYVDARRTSPEEPCPRFVREIAIPEPVEVEVDVAPSGPTSVWLDGRLVVAVPEGSGAVLGRSIRLPIPLSAGRHRWLVVTCEGPERSKGFYWREWARP